jgi:hypothetical protein
MRAPDGKAPPKHRFPWHDDVERRIRNGDDPKTAWTNTIMKGIYDGDLRPLADAIGAYEFERGIVLSCISAMITKGLLVAKRRRGRGKRGKGRGKSDRDIARAVFYEEQKAQFGSAKALEITAEKFSVCEGTIKRAIKHSHEVYK